jgi:hypothetical protein
MSRIREIPVGTLDGVNVEFQTSATYVPLTVFIFRNGQLMPKEFVIEKGGQQFEVCDPFEADEDVQVDYVPRVT